MKSVPALAVMAMMLLSNSFAHAQQARALMLAAGADGVHHIKELQTILTSENDTVSVVTVRQILYDAEILEGEILEEGDALVSLNGRNIRNLEHFFEMYSRLNTGAKVTVTFRRDEQKKEFWFRKPDVSGRVRIER